MILLPAWHAGGADRADRQQCARVRGALARHPGFAGNAVGADLGRGDQRFVAWLGRLSVRSGSAAPICGCRNVRACLG